MVRQDEDLIKKFSPRSNRSEFPTLAAAASAGPRLNRIPFDLFKFRPRVRPSVQPLHPTTHQNLLLINCLTHSSSSNKLTVSSFSAHGHPGHPGLTDPRSVTVHPTDQVRLLQSFRVHLFNRKNFAGVAANAATPSSFPNHSSPTGTELSPSEAAPQNCSSRSGPSFATGFSTSTALQTTHSTQTTTRWRTSSSPPAPPTLQCEGFGCTGTGAKVVDRPLESATSTPRAPTTR